VHPASIFETAVVVCLHLRDVRGFLILTAAVLLVIGVGVGTLSTWSENYGPIACSSVRDCVDIARAYGIQNPFVTPTNPDLRFEDGSFFPRSRWLGGLCFWISATPTGSRHLRGGSAQTSSSRPRPVTALLVRSGSKLAD
jgi:hypothetical protein